MTDRISDIIKLPRNDKDWSDDRLVNYQRVKSEEDFDLCEKGEPGPYDDHLVIDENHLPDRLCADRAEEVLREKGFWPLGSDWQTIKAKLGKVENAQNERKFRKEVASAILFIGHNGSNNDRWGEKIIFLRNNWNNLSVGEKNELLGVLEGIITDTERHPSEIEEAIKFFDYPEAFEALEHTLPDLLAGYLVSPIGRVGERAAMWALGRMEDQLIMPNLRKGLSETPEKASEIINKLREFEVPFDRRFQTEIERLLLDKEFFKYGKRDCANEAFALITALGHVDAKFVATLKAIVKQHRDYYLTIDALELLHSFDSEDAIDYAARLYRDDGTKGRNIAITHFYTKLYMRYKGEWNETSVKIAQHLVYALKTGKGIHYNAHQVSRVLAVYPHPSIKDDMRAALKDYEEWHKKNCMSPNVSCSTPGIIENLKRGLRKLD